MLMYALHVRCYPVAQLLLNKYWNPILDVPSEVVSFLPFFLAKLVEAKYSNFRMEVHVFILQLEIQINKDLHFCKN